jgi:hypothetical protein
MLERLGEADSNLPPECAFWRNWLWSALIRWSRDSGSARLVPVRVLVPPAPVLALVIAAQPVELAIFVMPLS